MQLASGGSNWTAAALTSADEEAWAVVRWPPVALSEARTYYLVWTPEPQGGSVPRWRLFAGDMDPRPSCQFYTNRFGAPGSASPVLEANPDVVSAFKILRDVPGEAMPVVVRGAWACVAIYQCSTLTACCMLPQCRVTQLNGPCGGRAACMRSSVVRHSCILGKYMQHQGLACCGAVHVASNKHT